MNQLIYVQVAEAQARLEYNKQYVAFLQHQIDIKEARAARQKAQENEVTPSQSIIPCNDWWVLEMQA